MTAPRPQAVAAGLLESARARDFSKAGELERDLTGVDPYAIDGDEARLAFWINLYNARVLHEFGERPRQGSLMRHRKLFRKVGYTVGSDPFPLDVIEHGLLRLNARPAYSPRRLLRASDRRLGAAPTELDPRVHFALNCAATSCPPVQSYEADDIDGQLDLATRAYLQAETLIDRDEPRVKLPYLLKLYKPDFGGSRKEALRFVSDRLPGPDGDWLRAQVEGEGEGVHVGWSDYDWAIGDD